SNSLLALGVCAVFSGAGPALAGLSADPSGGGRAEAQRTFTVNTDDGIAVVRINALGPGRASTETGYFQFVEDGRKVEITLQDHRVVSAKIDGKEVPAERVEFANDKVVIKDEAGKPVFEHQFAADAAGLVPPSGRSTLITDPEEAARAQALWKMQPVEPPKVMLGIQMGGVPQILRGHLGLNEGAGVLVSAVHGDLPAEKAGLRPYDVIIGANGKTDVTPQQVREILKTLNPGDTLDLDVIRKGERTKATVTTEAYDAHRLETSKVNAIAALSPEGGPAIASFGGDDDQIFFLNAPGRVGRGGAGSPFGDSQAWAEWERRMEEFAKRAMGPARGGGSVGGAFGGAGAADVMRERMERMEQMLQELMNRQQEMLRGVQDQQQQQQDQKQQPAKPRPGESQS
ncbi:MAG TPA: PDZ domain-containing protein, partial [Phycisphaerales bacterium]|nr:PDZ domain-containing protein [Phycisphaerales bacterium]